MIEGSSPRMENCGRTLRRRRRRIWRKARPGRTPRSRVLPGWERHPLKQRSDFSGFVLSLATTGMVHLGAIPDPVSGKREENLPGARQMIAVLTVLREKTRGNLSNEESKLLDSLIYEMQMGVMRQSQSIKL